MIEAPNPLGVHPTSISYAYKVFQHLDMLWIWAYECGLTRLCLCRFGVDFKKFRVGRSLSDIVMSWLTLQTHLKSIPHPCHMYTKCFSTLIWHGWAYGCALTLLCMCRSEMDFKKFRVGRSLSDIVMSWLRLQIRLEHIPHPCHMYTNCFNTLICCGWTYGCTLTLLGLQRLGWLSPSYVAMSYLRLQSAWSASLIRVIYVQSVLAHWYAVDGQMSSPLYCYACATGGLEWI